MKAKLPPSPSRRPSRSRILLLPVLIPLLLQLPNAISCNGSRTTTPSCGKTVVLMPEALERTTLAHYKLEQELGRGVFVPPFRPLRLRNRFRRRRIGSRDWGLRDRGGRRRARVFEGRCGRIDPRILLPARALDELEEVCSVDVCLCLCMPCE